MNDKLLSYTHEALMTEGESILLGLARPKDDPDNLYLELFYPDDFGNIIGQTLEMWSEAYGGIARHKAFPISGEYLAAEHTQVETDEATEYFAVLQDAGILSPSVYIDELVEPIETSRY